MKPWTNQQVTAYNEIDYDNIKTPVEIKADINGYTFFAKEVTENVIVIHGENRYAISDMFMRLSEYYEGESDELRGKIFTYEQCQDIFAKENNNRFEYHSSYDGFNVPSNSCINFFNTFNNFTEKEKFIKAAISKHVTSDKPFYLLGLHLHAAAMEHELAHAYWYLYPEYKENMSEFITETFDFDFIQGMSIRLKEMGYADEVIDDEIQAYICTSDIPYLDKWFKKLDWDFDKVKKAALYFNEFQKIKTEEWKLAIKKNTY